MKVVSRSKDDGATRASSFMDKLKNPKLIAEAMMSSDDDETPGTSAVPALELLALNL